jgi:DNA-binding transcriptional regulator GbsR (MarR family)
LEEKEPYFQVPKSLFRLRRDGGISLTAFDIYLLMLDRYNLSCKKENKESFTDKDGNIFICYSYEELMKELNTSKRAGISKGLKELEELGLVNKKRRFNKSTAFYISSLIVSSNQKGTIISSEKGTYSSNQKGTYSSSLKVDANKNNYNKHNMNKNNYNKNNNSVPALKNEIRLLIQNRNIKVENILKYCNDILRIKEVFEYANANEKHDAWIIACLRDNYILSKKQEKEEVYEKDYSLTAEDVLRGG